MFTCVRTRHPLPHKSSVIRFRHPHGVFTRVRVLHPSNMLNIEFRFCLLWFCIIAFTVNCLSALNVDVMCINHVYHCAGMTNQYTNCELCCNEILVSYWFVKVLLSLINQRYMSNTYWQNKVNRINVCLIYYDVLELRKNAQL